MASTTTPTPDAALLGAAVPGFPDEDVALPEVLVVEVAGAQVALPVEIVGEVLRLRGATRVPGAPEWVIGLLNVRGAVVAAGDLGRMLADEPSGGPIVLVEAEGRRAGLRVDAVVGVHQAELVTEALVGGGLPSAGVARLTSEAGGRGGAAELPLLDVRAVLDDILDGDASL